MKVVLGYIKSLSYQAIGWLVISYFMQIATDLASNIWLSEWSGDSTDPDNAVDPAVRLGVYGGIGAGQSKWEISFVSLKQSKNESRNKICLK